MAELSEVNVLGVGMEWRCHPAPLAIRSHFWFLDKIASKQAAPNLHPQLMKSRLTPTLLLTFFAAPLLSLSAQDQPTQTPESPAPALQIQDNLTPSAPAPDTTSQAAPSAASTVQEGAPAAADQAVPTTPATPSTDSVTPDPAAPPANSGQGSPGENPPASDPNSLIPPPAEPEQPSPINTAGNEEKQRQDQKSRYYTAKVKADKEEALASLLQKSEKAKSDESKRQALREYYDLLAKRIKKIDPSLSEWADTMHAAYLRRIAQVRVEPTIPVNVPPVPNASDSSTPAKKSQSSNDDETPAPRKKKRSSSSN